MYFICIECKKLHITLYNVIYFYIFVYYCCQELIICLNCFKFKYIFYIFRYFYTAEVAYKETVMFPYSIKSSRKSYIITNKIITVITIKMCK